jgi:hypothetical protein
MLTANRLTDGAVVWFDGDDWSKDFKSAAVLDAATAEGALAVVDPGFFVGPYLVEVDDASVVERRERLREAIRAGGPTVGHSRKAV